MNAAIVLAVGLLSTGDGQGNLIDRRIAERWTNESARPAPAADDHEFLRRLSLDLRGVIPTVQEARAFAADSDPARREKLVDAWLRGEDFAKYWARRWVDDLTVDRVLKLKFQGLYDAYEGWMRDALRSNMPYDRFAKRLLTAKGPLDLDPAAGFLLAALGQKEEGPKDVAERTARLFLGMQIRCAECHDHPFDDWTQQDFYGMAAFFWQSRAEVRSGKEMGQLDGWISDDPGKGEPAAPGATKGSFSIAYKSSGQRPADREPRRAAFARLLTADPQFARAAVNRHWGMLLGRGLVQPLDGFTATRKPSHPELLDELAADFVRSGYDVRRLLRSILLSKTYQLSSRGERAPERLFARALTTPMTPDQLYASLLRVTGGESGDAPPVKGKGKGENNREAFMREFRPPFEESDPFPAPAEPTISQALFLMNGELGTRGRASRSIEDLFLATLSRPPSAREKSAFAERKNEDVLWALLNSTEFVTRH